MANFIDKMKGSFDSRTQHEPTEIERVMANMNQVEMEMQNKLTQLGQIFYKNNLNSEKLEECYRTIIEDVKKLDENRKGFYTHKLRLEGNMMCVNCGEIIPYGSVYCSHCGKHADVKE